MDSAHVLLEARRRAQLTQRQLAQLADMQQPAIARIESGHVVPRVDTLERLLHACGHRLVTDRWSTDVDMSQLEERLAWTPKQRLDELVSAANALATIRGRAR